MKNRLSAFAFAALGLCMGGEALIVRTDESLSTAPEIGATIHVTPRADRLHWFDADTGKRL